MWQLIKRDYTIIFFFFIFAVFFKIALYGLTAMSILASDNLYYFSFLLMILYMTIFYLDDHAKVMRTVVSLPIKKQHIILSRYISLYSISLILFIFALIIDYAIDRQGLHFITVYLMFCALTVYIAVSTPIYYLFKRIWVTVFVHYCLLIFGALAFAFLMTDPFDWFEPFLTVVFTVLDFQPIVVSLLFLLVLMYISYRVAYFLFSRKDIQ